MNEALISSRKLQNNDTVRLEYERAFSERFSLLQKYYEVRFQSLKESIEGVIKKIMEDQLLGVLKKDTTTSEYFSDRAKEIFIEIIENERQIIIERLGEQLAFYKSEHSKIERDNLRMKADLNSLNELHIAKLNQIESTKIMVDKLKHEIDSLERAKRIELEGTRNEIYAINIEKEREIAKLKNQQRETIAEMDNLRSVLKDKQNLIRELNQHQKQLGLHNKEANTKLNHAVSEIEHLQRLNQEQRGEKAELENQMKKMIHELEDKLDEMENNHKDIQDRLKKQYKEKVSAYKKKIEEYKAKFGELATKKSQHDKNYPAIVKTIEELEHRLTATVQDNDKKMNELRNLKDRERMELEKKHDYQMKEFQNYYEKLLEAKMQEVESEAVYHINLMKDQQNEFRMYMENKAEEYDHNFIRKKDHQSIVHEKAQVVERLNFDMNQKQLKIRQLKFKVELLEATNDKNQKEVDEAKSKLEDYENILNEQKKRRKQLEEQLEAAKNNDKKTKRVLYEYEDKIRSINTELEDRNKKLAKFNQKYSLLENEYKEIEFKNIKNKQYLDELENRIRDQTHEFNQAKKDNNDLTLELQKLKQSNVKEEFTQKQEVKSIEQKRKEYEERLIRESERVNQLTANQIKLKGKIDILQANLEESKMKLQEWSQKCNKLQWSLRDQKNRTSDAQSNLQKHIVQFSRKESEFKGLASRFEQEISKKDEAICELENQINALEHRIHNQNHDRVKLSLAVKKNINTELVSLSKEINSLKEYIGSMKKLYSSEMSLWINTFNREIEDTLRKKQMEFIAEKKYIKQEYQKELERISKSLTEKLRSEQTLVTFEKQKEATQMQEIIKKHLRECEYLGEELSRGKSIISELESKLKYSEQGRMQNHQLMEVERDKYKRNLNDLLAAFRAEKEEMLKENADKSEEYEVEFRELNKMLKILKKQSEFLKEVLESSKLKHQKEFETSTEKERTLTKSLREKSELVDKLEEAYEKCRKQLKFCQEQYNSLKQAEKTKSNELLSLQTKLKSCEEEYEQLRIINHENEQQINLLHKKAQELESINLSTNEKKHKLELEIAEMKSVVGRSMRYTDNESLRMAKILDNETKQLTNKVKQLKKINSYLGQKESLRS